MRRGLSLLEVLLSMFILAVGLLGVAALIPVGKYYLNEASTADRGSNVGRSSLQEFKVRGYADESLWLSHEDEFTVALGTFVWPYIGHDPAMLLQSTMQAGGSVCIDPLFVSRNVQAANNAGAPLASDWAGRAFPFVLDNDPVSAGGLASPRMTRVTLDSRSLMVEDGDIAPALRNLLLARGDRPSELDDGTLVWLVPSQIVPAVADLAFRSRDDLLFGQPENDAEGGGRPVQRFSDVSSGEYLGDYSWLATVSPGASTESLSVAIAIFQRRITAAPEVALDNRGGAPPSERAVWIEFPFGAGFGGQHSAQLRLPVANEDTPTEMPPLSAGQWILVSGWAHDSFSIETSLGSSTLDRRPIFRWFEVASAEEAAFESDPYGLGEEWLQNVTLNGPALWGQNVAFDTVYFDADETGPGATLHAGIIDGLIAVHQETVRPE